MKVKSKCREAVKELGSGGKVSRMTSVIRQLINSFQTYQSVHGTGQLRDGHTTTLFNEPCHRLILIRSDADELAAVVNHSSQPTLRLQSLHAINCILPTRRHVTARQPIPATMHFPSSVIMKSGND